MQAILLRGHAQVDSLQMEMKKKTVAQLFDALQLTCFSVADPEF